MTPLIGAALAVAAGTGLGLGRPALAMPLTAVAAGWLLLAIGAHRRGVVAFVAALVALAAAAGGSAAWRSRTADEALLPRLAAQGAVVRACGGVRELRPHSVGIETETVKLADRSWTVHEPLRVSGHDVKRSRVGDRICAIGDLAKARPGRDESPLLGADYIDRVGVASHVRLAADALRRRFAVAARRALPKRQSGLLLGMTDGDTADLDDATLNAFRTTGLAHLVAVSGENVAVLLVVVVLFSRFVIKRGRWLRALVAMPPLVFFAFLTGLQPSVLRAVITAGVALAVVAEGRRAEALDLTAFAFVVLTLASPDVLFNIGFQLSFGATLGIVMWARSLTERFAKWLPEGKLGETLAVAAATTVAAQGAVAPVLAWHFGRVPALGGVANLVTVPLAPFITVGGLATLGLASVFRFLDWAPAMLRLPLDWILWCANVFAKVPFASTGANVLIGVAVAATLAAALAPTKRVRAGSVAFVLVFGAAAGGQALAHTSCDGSAIYALDIGQGTAVLLKDGEHAVLADSGPKYGGVVAQLEALGVTHLDAVVLSHQHIDHMEGAVDVLRRVKVDRVIVSPNFPNGNGAEVVRAARRAHVRVVKAIAGDSFDFGPMHADVMWPATDEVPPFSEDLIDPYSLVVRVRIASTAVFLPGDIRTEQQSALTESAIDTPIMVAAHHGSKNLEPKFVDAVSPRLTLVTVGADNPYGLPAPQALRTYARHGPVFRTDRDGRVAVCLSPGGAEIYTEKR
jgi:competence protein ComEC